MTELRKDPIVGYWSVVHTDDSWTPDMFEKQDTASRRQSCQFCPGSERMTPPEIDAYRKNGSKANEPGWDVRVVPNKFPALGIEGTIDPHREGVFDRLNGIGAHEVLIETPDHQKHLTDLTDEEVGLVIQKYQSRVIDLTNDKRFKYIMIFKNHGEAAGATVEHAHSQIIALPMIPKYVVQELEGAKKYFTETKQCIFCDVLKQEQEDKGRIVAENEHFVTFCPFVPRYPFECWIMPKDHSSAFIAIEGAQRLALAGLLKETLLRLKSTLSDLAYNYYLHIAPVNDQDHPYFHWHMEIVPKLTQISGFEWGTGFYVVRTEPSLAAKYLREAQIA